MVLPTTAHCSTFVDFHATLLQADLTRSILCAWSRHSSVVLTFPATTVQCWLIGLLDLTIGFDNLVSDDHQAMSLSLVGSVSPFTAYSTIVFLFFILA